MNKIDSLFIGIEDADIDDKYRAETIMRSARGLYLKNPSNPISARQIQEDIFPYSKKSVIENKLQWQIFCKCLYPTTYIHDVLIMNHWHNGVTKIGKSSTYLPNNQLCLHSNCMVKYPTPIKRGRYNMGYTEPIGTTISKKQKETLLKIAKEENLNLSQLLRKIFIEWLENQESASQDQTPKQDTLMKNWESGNK